MITPICGSQVSISSWKVRLKMVVSLLIPSLALLTGCGLQKTPAQADAPVVTGVLWEIPAAIAFGTPLSSSELNAVSNKEGIFKYQPDLGAVLSAGSHQLSVVFTPANAIDGVPLTRTVTLEVTPVQPLVTWPAPTAVDAGTVLTALQLNASSSVQGTFSYIPAAGTVLPSGVQQLTTTFTPTDSQNYTQATATRSVTIRAAKTIPQISWSTPSAVTYGTPLSPAQLNATANVAGNFAYSQALGAVLPAGQHQLNVTFMPADATAYLSSSSSVVFTVTPVQPLVTWPAPTAVDAGTVLTALQLNASSSVQGTFSYIPAAGTVLPSGVQQLTTTFTPTDSQNYTQATATRSVTIRAAKTIPQISWSTPSAVTYGTPLSPAQLNATANVAGNFAYSQALGAVLPAGQHQLSAVFTPNESNLYSTSTSTVLLVVNPAYPSISWPSPAPITAGGPLNTTRLNAVANIPGSITYNPGLGTVLASGMQELTATFTPSDQINYLVTTASVLISVQQPAITQLTTSPGVLPLGKSIVTLIGGTFSSGATVTVDGQAVAFTRSSPRTINVSIFVPPWRTASSTFEVNDPALEGGTGTVTVPITTTSVSFDAAARFARQAGFGPRPDLVFHIQQVGFQTFLQEQMQTPVYQYMYQPSPPTQWIRNTVIGNGVLRQRVALALASFIVTYAQDTSFADYAMWEETLEKDAFGNFRDLMTDTALNPSMGRTLNLAGNWASTSPSVHPNQNFAREFMQLFTIGPYMLNDDGSKLLNSNGNPVASYNQDDVLAMSNILTGWSYPAPVNSLWTDQGVDYTQPLVAFDQNHDKSSKTLFGNTTIPAGQSAAADMAAAFDAVFSHPNVPPFVAVRLIGQLTTSNPSQAYVSRISRVFEDNGKGVRGDLGAVVNAILMDPEARSGDSGTQDSTFGVLHDPTMLTAEAFNAMQVAPNDDQFLDANAIPSEPLFVPPSVFGYDSPTYQVPNSTLVSPAFQLLNDKSLIGQSQLFLGVTQENLFVNWSTGPSWLDTTFLTLPDYVEALNHLLFSGRLSAAQCDLITSGASSTTGALIDQEHQAAFLALNTDSFGVAH